MRPKLLAASVPDPREQLVRREAKRHRREEMNAGDFFSKNRRRTDTCPPTPAPTASKRFERTHQRAGGKHLDLDPPTCRVADCPRETNGHGVDTRCRVGPVGHHL